MRITLSLLLISLSFISCIETINNYTVLPPGKWRGVLKLSEPGLIESQTITGEAAKLKDYFELPFNLNVEYINESMHVYLLNGEESIEIENISFGRDPKTAKDSILFEFIAFDSYMEGFHEENYIEGYWHVNYKKGYQIPFILTFGQNHRFNVLPTVDNYDFSGNWNAIFEYDNQDAYPAQGQFKQNGQELSGTFTTETGDYRYLHGNVQEDKMKLSVFDGSHAFLFTGQVSNDTIYGEFRSGKHYKAKWKAFRSDAIDLKDPYFMTLAIKGAVDDFEYVSSTGEQVNLNQLNAEVKLINIMGTWCPNCRDEINFLKELKTQYDDSEIAVVSLAFERYKDEGKALIRLQDYKKTMGFDWPILLGGYANKGQNSEQLDFIDNIYSYPTLVVLDSNNEIKHIHTGFYGPATEEFSRFKQDFLQRIENLLIKD